jgi:hypothetical protein
VTARAALFEALNVQGRRNEAMEFGKHPEDFWTERNRGEKDLTALPRLVKIHEAKRLPAPGARVLLSSTGTTLGEWKLYLRGFRCRLELRPAFPWNPCGFSNRTGDGGSVTERGLSDR